MSNIQLFEALKQTIGVEAARMIAEVVPPARDLATKSDVQALRADFESLRADFEGLRAEFGGLRAEFGGLRAEFGELEARIEARIEARFSRLMQVMLVSIVPLWLGVWGTLVTVLLKS